MIEFFEIKAFCSILDIVRAISLVVEQRSPKPLVGVRFLHRPQEKIYDIIIDFLDVGIESRSASARGGVARFFNRKILVTDKCNHGPPSPAK